MAEDPIIIKGGSVSVEHSEKLNGGGGSGRRTIRNANYKLLRLKINNEPERALDPGDTITIYCDDGEGKP